MKKFFSLAAALLACSAVAKADVAEFVSISPAAGSGVGLDTEYVITFSQPVTYVNYLSDITIGYNPFGDGDGAIFSQSEDQTQITCKLDMDMIAMYGISDLETMVAWFGNTLTVNFYNVKDAATGERLPGNDPETEGQYTFSYSLGAAQLRIEPLQGNVESLNEFYFGFAEGIKLNEEIAASTEILFLKDKQVVETITADKLTFVSYGIGGLDEGDDDFGVDDDEAGYYMLTLAETYTDYGNYELYVPEGVFLLGADATPNETIIASYTIADANATYIIDPAEGEVTSLDTFTLTYKGGEPICPAFMDGLYITLTNELGETIGSWDSEYFNDNMEEDWFAGWDVVLVRFKLDETLTTPGTYTLNIPEQFFIVGSEYDWGKEANYVYTIGNPDALNSVSVTRSAEMYNLQGQRVNEAKGIVIKGGKKIRF